MTGPLVETSAHVQGRGVYVVSGSWEVRVFSHVTLGLRFSLV